jgi:hypothetical protein
MQKTRIAEERPPALGFLFQPHHTEKIHKKTILNTRLVNRLEKEVQSTQFFIEFLVIFGYPAAPTHSAKLLIGTP